MERSKLSGNPRLLDCMLSTSKWKVFTCPAVLSMSGQSIETLKITVKHWTRGGGSEGETDSLHLGSSNESLLQQKLILYTMQLRRMSVSCEEFITNYCFQSHIHIKNSRFKITPTRIICLFVFLPFRRVCSSLMFPKLEPANVQSMPESTIHFKDSENNSWIEKRYPSVSHCN